MDVALASRVNVVQAEALKYLELARAMPQICNGNLSSCKFQELGALTRIEQLARDEAAEVPQVTRIPPAWEPHAMPAFASYESVHRLPDPEDAVALKVLDLMLHFGIPNFVSFLIRDTGDAYNFLSPATINSEACRLQLVKAAMLGGDWDLAIQLTMDLINSVGDRLRQIYVLLGECYFRRAKAVGTGSAADFADSLRAFETVLSFLPEGESSTSQSEDPVLHLRVATIFYMQAEEASFSDAEIMAKAVTHYKKSLQIVRTAEAWRNAGVCAYRQACLLSRRLDDASLAKQRQGLLRDALQFFKEANRMDNSRPQINAWLVVCAVELGLVQIAKQTLRQVLRHPERLDFATAAELAQLLLRFSNERNAESGERKVFVQDGRYAQEAAAVARIALTLGESEEVRRILASALEMTGESPDAETPTAAQH